MTGAVIVQAITHLPPGGAQRVVLDLCRGLDRRRFHVHLIVGPGGDWLPRAREISDCTVHVAEALVREVHPLKDLRVIPQLYGILRKISRLENGRPMIVHSHAPKAGLAARAAARLHGAAIVHTLHGLPFNDGQSFVKRHIFKGLEAMGYGFGGQLVSVTEANRAFALRNKWVKPEDVHVIRPSVNLERLAPRNGPRRALTAHGVGEDDFVLGMVASLKPPKDPAAFLQAFFRLAATDPRLRAVLAGDGFLRPELERLVKVRGMGERVHFLGWVDPVEKLLPELDLLCLPSHSEGLPLALVEARAAGIPLVASDVGGIRECVTHDETGLLVPPGDVSALTDAMGRLIRDGALRERLVRNGLQNLEPYRWEEMVRRHEALYSEMLGMKEIDPHG